MPASSWTTFKNASIRRPMRWSRVQPSSWKRPRVKRGRSGENGRETTCRSGTPLAPDQTISAWRALCGPTPCSPSVRMGGSICLPSLSHPRETFIFSRERFVTLALEPSPVGEEVMDERAKRGGYLDAHRKKCEYRVSCCRPRAALSRIGDLV